MRGPTEEARAEARRLYESGETLLGISKVMGIHRATLRNLRDKECWIVHPVVHVDNVSQKAVQQRTQSQVIDIATRKAVERLEQSGAIEAQADEIAEGLQVHGRIAKLMLSFSEKILFEAMNEGLSQSKAEAFNAIISGVGRAVDKSRDIAGLKSGQVSRPIQADSSDEIFGGAEFVIAQPPEDWERPESQSA